PIAGTISVEYDDGTENTLLHPKHVLIATGSKPIELPSLPFDGVDIINTTDALQLTELPKSITIIGGGIIGIEWASLLTDLGTRVTVVEQAETILVNEDDDVRKEVERALKGRGVRIITSAF